MGLTHSDVRGALEDARIDHLGTCDGEASGDGGHGAAVLAEWERIERLLAGTTAVYLPESDPLVQEERAAGLRQEAVRSEREAGRRATGGAAPAALQLTRPAATVTSMTGAEEPRDSDARSRIRRRDRIDAWLAQALADHGGFPGSAGPPTPARAGAALLSALARAGAPVDACAQPFVERLADADAASVAALAAWLDGVLP
ncbi:hypothetical protein [Streptomyces sp. NPDC086010]|uniref:hypothetical protein n=1 Tax=Streptomyces sp. NPDC086010 TaxID=3365745 RepID=UPI0037D95468